MPEEESRVLWIRNDISQSPLVQAKLVYVVEGFDKRYELIVDGSRAFRFTRERLLGLYHTIGEELVSDQHLWGRPVIDFEKANVDVEVVVAKCTHGKMPLYCSLCLLGIG